jgi:tetratricopeptide (TPR) repeat protein
VNSQALPLFIVQRSYFIVCPLLPFSPSSVVLYCLFRAPYDRGNARGDKGDLEGAIADHSNAIELNPHFAEAYANRRLNLLAQGKAMDAERDFAACLKLNRELKAYLDRRIKEIKERRPARPKAAVHALP